MNRFFAIAAVWMSACVADEEAYVVGAEVLPPDDSLVFWDEAFNGIGDAMVAVVPVDVMVYDAQTGEPHEGVELLLAPNTATARALHTDEVLLTEPDSCLSPCEGAWDAYRDFVVRDVGAEEGSDRLLMTDENGLARAYVEVDAFPIVSGEWEPVMVNVLMGPRSVEFLLIPE